VEALWKISKIKLDRTIQEACDIILSGNYFFLSVALLYWNICSTTNAATTWQWMGSWFDWTSNWNGSWPFKSCSCLGSRWRHLGPK